MKIRVRSQRRGQPCLRVLLLTASLLVTAGCGKPKLLVQCSIDARKLTETQCLVFFTAEAESGNSYQLGFEKDPKRDKRRLPSDSSAWAEGVQ